ncbi:MAG: B12-binding domain-containing radical SAM protein [Planctomycetota bacterium]
MRVLFVYPSIDCPVGFNHGLAAMSGVLKAEGHETRLLHVNEGLGPIPTVDDVLALVEEYEPGVVGFSVMSQQYPWACEIARGLRDRGVRTPLVVGGVHCTMVPDEVVRDPWWDLVFVGEADYAFLDYVNRLESGGDLESVSGTRFMKDGMHRSVAVGTFPDLETIAPKDYDLFDIGRILEVKNGWVSILTSRGCPYKCTYCFNKEIVDLYQDEGGSKSPREYLRRYDIDRILGEILSIKERFPDFLKTVIFDDDLFTLDKKYVLRFCEAYKEAGIDLPYVVNAHVQVFDDEIAFALMDSGCLIAKFGLESGSDRVRKEVLWRFMPDRKIIDSFRAAQRYDLHTSAFVMLGLPTETREEIEETLDMCAEIKMGRFRWAIFYPFPGTAGYTIANDLDLIDFEKAKSMGNYFDASCLKFGEEHDFYLERLAVFCHWYVNARSDWPCRETYAELVEQLEGMTREEFRARKDELKRHDRQLSNELMEKGVVHYSQRYSHVMGVRSDFVVWEREQLAQGKILRPTTYTLD